jgi:hypothetical protein
MRRSDFFLIVAWLACCGCGTPPPNTDRFVPSPETGQQALAAALRAWQDGRSTPANLDGIEVNFVDTHRKPGQRLRRFAILGETPGDGPRCFAVRLWLEEPTEEIRVRYVVWGINPLWVSRHENYLMMIHWVCAEDTPATTPATDRPAGPPTAPATGKPAPAPTNGKVK